MNSSVRISPLNSLSLRQTIRLLAIRSHLSPPPSPALSPSVFSRAAKAKMSSSSSSPAIPKFMKGVLIEKTGGTEVLKYRDDLPVPVPKDGEVLVKIEFIGINYIDTYFRTGLYNSPKPEILGQEGSGRVVSLGPSPHDASLNLNINDRVVWIGKSTYAEYSIALAARVFKIPSPISSHVACAAFLQGLTALTLVEEAYKVLPGDWVLITAASGGVGGWLCQLLRARKAKTIAVVGSKGKVDVARLSGADIVLVDDGTDDVLGVVKRETGGEGVRVVFDGVGQSTFERSLECVRRKGSLVSYGNSSGAVPPFRINRLAARNIKIARPSLHGYIETREEFKFYCDELFRLIAEEKFTVRIHEVYPLQEVARAHNDIEGRKTMGKLLMTPLEVPETTTDDL